jgi:FSR family fosmidomycin resistance protein-like MFS transporter
MLSRTNHALILIALGHWAIEVANGFLPVVYPILIATLGLSYAQVGTIALVAGVSTSLVQPLFGYISDRWLPHLITALSIVWSGALMGLVGFSWDYPSVVLIVGLGALGSAAFHPSGASIAGSGGAARRGAAVSVFSVGGNLGAAVSPLLVTAGIGWWGLRGTAVLIPLTALVGLLIFLRLEGAQRANTRPHAVRTRPAATWPRTWLLLIVLSMLFRAWFQMGFMTYLPAWVEDQGGTLTAGGRYLFVFLTCVGLGSLGGGALSDRIGRWPVLALALSLLGPAEWVFLSVPGPWQPLWLGIIGVLLGATFPVSIVLAQEAWPWGAGVASGLVMGLPWIGGGIGASITGWMADHFDLTLGLRSLILPALLSGASILLYAALQRRRPARADA